jgi:hypothetical protein
MRNEGQLYRVTDTHCGPFHFKNDKHMTCIMSWMYGCNDDCLTCLTYLFFAIWSWKIYVLLLMLWTFSVWDKCAEENQSAMKLQVETNCHYCYCNLFLNNLNLIWMYTMYIHVSMFYVLLLGFLALLCFFGKSLKQCGETFTFWYSFCVKKDV